jgi:uncharacterized protein YqhQ
MIAYEYIRLMSRFLDSPIVKTLFWPNLALQRLTAYQPSIDMVEVAISAFKRMQEEEAK